jgi:hypothetical protein
MCTDIRTGGTYFAVLALLLLTVPAAADDDIQKAVQRGVAFLQAHPSANGMWTFDDHGHTVGVSALVGLALLECEVPASDPVVQSAAEAVRKRVASIDDTYDVSLAVMFLDRLAANEDGPLIQTCCMRLVAGQTSRGGWGYFCPKISTEAELRRLRTALLKKDAAKRDKATEKQQPPVRGDLLNNQLGQFTPRGMDDNSNTQFATLALWIARRHDVKADAALSSVEARFRRSQNADGGWSYMPVARAGMPGGMLGSTGSMTCAGLLGLAVGYGVATQAVLRTNANQRQAGPAQKEGPDANRDLAIQRGLTFLGRIMQPGLTGSEGGDSPDAPRPEDRRGIGGRRGGRPGGMQGRGAGSSVLHNGLGSEYYFLWSVERVAVLYGLETIGDKDWFTIGSKYLLQEQSDDGAWRGNLGEVVDTCFALFFLRRANLAGDLTSTLRGKIRDPGTVSLRTDKAVKEVAQNRKAAEPKAAEEKSVAKDLGPKQKRETLQVGPAQPRAAQPNSPPSVPSSQTQTHDQEVSRLRDQLAKASAQEQASLLEKLRDGKGSINTDALAASIPTLSDAAKTKARDALAERLTRMTPATLREKLKDSNVEVRRAAALACAMKEDKSFVPDLIALLDDSEPRVTRAAHAALKTLTGTDLGPTSGANSEQRKEAIARWRQWWRAELR